MQEDGTRSTKTPYFLRYFCPIPSTLSSDAVPTPLTPTLNPEATINPEVQENSPVDNPDTGNAAGLEDHSGVVSRTPTPAHTPNLNPESPIANSELSVNHPDLLEIDLPEFQEDQEESSPIIAPVTPVTAQPTAVTTQNSTVTSTTAIPQATTSTVQFPGFSRFYKLNSSNTKESDIKKIFKIGKQSLKNGFSHRLNLFKNLFKRHPEFLKLSVAAGLGLFPGTPGLFTLSRGLASLLLSAHSVIKLGANLAKQLKKKK
ncbi:MAG: hypothetical protein WC436_02190 [Candidatus Babeliales bacterium]